MDTKNTLFILDDDIDITETLEMLLEDHFNVVTSNDPIDAMLQITTVPNVEIVISDFMMPNMNGTEFFKSVNQYNPKIYRMMLSGYADAKMLNQSIKDGTIQKFIMKPWDADILITIINQILSKKMH